MKGFKDFLAVALLGTFCLLVSPGTQAGQPTEQFCKDLIYDVNKIAKARAESIPKDALHNLVNHSPELSQERASDINVMIEEAYSKGNTEELIEWMKATVANCTI